MTHYTRRYKGTSATKRQAALRDCREFLGPRRYRHIRAAIAQDRDTSVPLIRQRRKIRFITATLSMAGIQGYPAQALALDVLANGA